MKILKLWLFFVLVFIVACSSPNEPTTTSTETEPTVATASEDTVEVPTEVPTEEPTEEPTQVAEEVVAEETVEEDDDHGHEHGDDTHTHSDTVDLSRFMDGALAEDVTVVDCTLTDGTVTQCYEITVVGTPVNHDVGPFCPTDISDDETAGGLWLDGEGSYVIDGPFFTELADIYSDELWNNIYNDDGSINVIDNAEDFKNWRISRKMTFSPKYGRGRCRFS